MAGLAQPENQREKQQPENQRARASELRAALNHSAVGCRWGGGGGGCRVSGGGWRLAVVGCRLSVVGCRLAGLCLSGSEHFVVNVSVAGGLVLLRGFGAGKYSVDELMKKQD